MVTRMPWLPRFQAWPVKLPLQVAVVYQGVERVPNLSSVSDPVSKAVDFYRAQRIVLQPSIRGVALEQQAYEDLTINPGFAQIHTHAFQLDGAPMTVIYLSEEPRWREGTLGRAYPQHLAVVAGHQTATPGTQDLAAETLIHEIGHLLLSDPPTENDHLNDNINRNFMHETIWAFGSGDITTQQRTRMYEAAYMWGSL